MGFIDELPWYSYMGPHGVPVEYTWVPLGGEKPTVSHGLPLVTTGPIRHICKGSLCRRPILTGYSIRPRIITMLTHVFLMHYV